MYIIDPEQSLPIRLAENRKLEIPINSNLIELLDKTIRDNNIFAQSYNMMKQEIEIQKQLFAANNIQKDPELELIFTLNPGMDARRYNFQRTNEVAAIFTMTADGEIPDSYVTVRSSVQELQYINSMSPFVEPWIYPLFYPFGTLGWHGDMHRSDNNRRITRNAYVKYLIGVRDNFNPILSGRRLFQQWIVDMYVKVEKDRMTYLRMNQQKLRVDSYQGLMDHLEKSANENNCRVGKVVILPSTFIGSQRHMMQNYQDSMGIVSKYGKPDIFLTMTSNPKWTEIQENLLPGQQAADRPDICARVFDLKKKFFGECIAYVYVIEFQKRGLPHMHLLITLKENSKLRTAEQIKKYISAEIPDVNINPDLHRIVVKNMLHSCGDWCKVEGKCSKHFPYAFTLETIITENGNIFYQRRNNGVSYEGQGGRIFDNRYVVPYSPELLQIFNCHINFVAVSSVKSVKYLYKYIYKGHDSAAVTIQEPNNNAEGVIDSDEIKDFLETRYVGPVEAAYRLLNKPLQEKSHTIYRLPVHLPNQHTVTLDASNSNNATMSPENILLMASQQNSMLIYYFALNARDPEARNYLYTEIPSYYVLKKDISNAQRWSSRKRFSNTIGRMYSVNPSNLELFHLRILLLNVKGATSFEDLRTVNGVLLDTFTEACLVLGLIENDFEWDRVLQEGSNWMMPAKLRQLFVSILIHCRPLHPENLWEKYKDSLSENYFQNNTKEAAYRKAYADINKLLIEEGHSLNDFASMNQEVFDDEESANADDVSNEQLWETGVNQYMQLNDEQRAIVDKILAALENENSRSRCFFINGPGGSGKTFIYKTLDNILTSQNKIVCSMAFTGIAATLLNRGRTAHKVLGLSVPLLPDSSVNIKIQSKEGQFLKSVDLFIFDEAPMAPKYCLKIMDRTLQDIMNTKLPFGGKTVVLGGDFRQLLPVLPRGNRSETLSLSIKYSPVWKFFEKFTLTKNMRVLPEEVDFSQFLLKIGDGSNNDYNDNVKIPEKCNHVNQNIAESLFGKFIEEKKFEDMASTAILSARNADVDKIYKQVVELLDSSSERNYFSIDSTENCDDNGCMSEAILPEYLNSLNPPSLPPHELCLRKHCIVMLIRNLNINEGLCNGTRLLILDLSPNLLKCKILTGDKTGNIIFLHRILLYCDNLYPFTFKRRQFPIKLAFAMTINKSQGQTFQSIALDLERDVFSHGQLYVAMTRVRCWEAFKIFITDKRSTNVFKNVVYKELFDKE